MKKCYKCSREKTESSFNKDNSTRDGLRNLCRACDNLKSRQYHHGHQRGVLARMRQQKEERKLLLQKMFGTKCWRCGSTEELEFHHRDPKLKLFNVGSSWRRDLEIVKTEIEKCDLLCFK